MSFARAEVERLAKLARLELSAEEIAKYSNELGSILEYVDTLSKLAINQHDKKLTTVKEGAKLREDVVKPTLNQAEYVAKAFKHKHNFVVVPKVFED